MPQKPKITPRQAKIGCFGAAFEKNVLSLSLDTAGLLITFAAPEAKLVQLSIAAGGIVSSSFSGDKIGFGIGFVGYHGVALDGQFLSQVANDLTRVLGKAVGAAAVLNDLNNIHNETQECRANGGQ